MSTTFEAIKKLAALGQVRISEHGYDELVEDSIPIRDILIGIETATVVEDYPAFAKGPAVLVLQFDSKKRPIHVVWGIPKGAVSPAVLVTAYRPDTARWNNDFTGRRN